MYSSPPDPYCYDNSQVLVNLFGIQDADDLEIAEAVFVTNRGLEPLPTGDFLASHYCSIHRHLFQDVYAWAGKIRTVRISKGDTLFCLPEYIDEQLERCFARLRDVDYLVGLSADDFASGAARFLADLNAIHPFREGNGRTQHAFLAMLANHAGFPMVFPESQAELDAFKMAVIGSFAGQLAPLETAIRRIIRVD